MHCFGRIHGALNWLSFLLLIASACVVFLFELSKSSIDQGSDEVIYARVTQTLAQSWEHGEVGFPLQHGALPFYEKPPLKFVLGSVVLQLIGNSNLGLRLFDGILGVVAVFVTVILIKVVTHSVALGLATGFLVLLIPEWVLFAHSFRHSVLDGLLTVLILFASIWGWFGYKSLYTNTISYKSLAIFSGICGLATLVKSVAGVVPVLSMAMLLLMNRLSLREKFKGSLALSVGPLIFLTYCLFISVSTPKALQTFLGTEILHRASSGFDGHNVGQPLYYLKYLLERAAFLPLGLVILGCLGFMAAFGKGMRNTETKVSASYLLGMALFPVALYSLSSAKLPWYLSPYAPFFIGSMLYGCYLGSSYLSHRFSSSISPIITASVCGGFVLLLSLFSILPRAERIAHFVIQPKKRIAIDLVVEKILATQSRVLILDNAISSRAAPIKGRFNVEGIYKEMLTGRLTSSPSSEKVNPESGTFVFINREKLAVLPSGYSEFAVLPPLFPRKSEVVVVRY